MTGLNEPGKSLTRPPDLVSTHRSGNVEDYSYGNRRVVIAEESDLLLLLLIVNRESVFIQTGYVAAVSIRYGDRQVNQIGMRYLNSVVAYFFALFQWVGSRRW